MKPYSFPKNLFCRIIVIAMLLFMISAVQPRHPANAAGSSVKVDGLWWSIDKETGTITWIPYDWEGGEIPDELDGIKITAIGQWACYNNEEGRRDHLKTVILPESITRLDNGAFHNCVFKSIKLPESLEEIGDQAFEGCANLKSIDIPSSVTTIGRRAFAECTSLKTVEMH
ncbi:MAG: leucine-rich repeat domain-containing protein [Lachnospiraceae bacterium]|nr:leucine-rich repeat domain-containing protein [Lachnospiraceae bacterium]